MSRPTVFLVEDSDDMRQTLVWVLECEGFSVAPFESPNALLEGYDPDLPGCLLLDFRLPGMTGLELYERLRQQGCTHPYIVITAHGDIPLAVDTMRAGAIDFIPKPVNHRRLFQRIEEGFEQDRRARENLARQAEFQARLSRLTPREREVLDQVLEGHLSREIADTLSISVKTVEVHRSRIVKKLGVDSMFQVMRLFATMSEGPLLATA